MASEKQLEANRQNARKSTGPKTDDGKAVSCVNAVRHGILARVEVLPHVEDAQDYEDHVQRTVGALAPAGYLEETLAERCASLLWRLGRVVRYEREIAALKLEETEEPGGDRLFEGGVLTSSSPIAEAEERLRIAEASLALSRRLESAKDKELVDSEIAANIMETVARVLDVDIWDSDELSFPGYPDGVDMREVEWTAGHLRACVQVVLDHSKPRGGMEDVSDIFEEYLSQVRGKHGDLLRKLDRKRRRGLLPSSLELDKTTRYETTLERSFFKTLHELQRLQTVRAGGHVPAPVAVDVTVQGEAA